jgi:hypothetical protein
MKKISQFLAVAVIVVGSVACEDKKPAEPPVQPAVTATETTGTEATTTEATTATVETSTTTTDVTTPPTETNATTATQ